MKTISLTKKLFLCGIIALCAGASSCKKKESPQPAAAANGTLMLHFHSNADTNEVEEYNDVYVMNGGRKISVSMCQLYVSGIQLVKADGSFYDVNGVTILTRHDVEEYLVGSVPAGNYKSIRFNVGLSPASNTVTPASNDSTFNKPGMWFGATAQPAGYVFINFQGKIDTSNAANGTVAQMQPFQYKIGTNANLKNVAMPDQNYSVIPNQAQFVHITMDYGKLFTGIKLNTAANLIVNTPADNVGALATQISGNIASMFRYEE